MRDYYFIHAYSGDNKKGYNAVIDSHPTDYLIDKNSRANDDEKIVITYATPITKEQFMKFFQSRA